MSKRTDFEIDLERIERDIIGLQDCALALPTDAEQATRFVARLYQRASLTGNLQELDVAAEAMDRAIRQIGPWPDLWMLKANLDFKLHRLANATRDLDSMPGLGSTMQGRALRADIRFQEGRYDEARMEYERLIRDDRTWDNLARLAYFESNLGDAERTEQLY